jgi:hypothetical protein
MNAEKEVLIFGGKWQVEVHVFGFNFAVRVVCQSAPQNFFGGVNFHPVANLGLRRRLQPKSQNKEHTVYGSLRAVANTQAKNSDSESILNSGP